MATTRWRRWLFRLTFWPAYAWHWLRRSLGAGQGWLCEVEPNLYLSAVPTPRDVQELARRGVRAVVNVCEEYGGPVARYRRAGIEQLRLPILDYAEPSADEVERALAFMRGHVEAERAVLVHCKAGRGRSATLILCWLVAARGMAPEEAQRALASLRPRVAPRLYLRSVVQALHRGQLSSRPSASDDALG